jgi:hypothetical protein
MILVLRFVLRCVATSWRSVLESMISQDLAPHS